MGYPDFQTYNALATLIANALASAGIPVIGNPIQLYAGNATGTGGGSGGESFPIGFIINPDTYGLKTWPDAINYVDSLLTVPLAATITRQYLPEGSWPKPGSFDFTQYAAVAAMGCRQVFCVKPSRTLSSAEKTNLLTFINNLKAANIPFDMCLWTEFNNGKAFPSGQVDYPQYNDYYAPTVLNAGVNLIFNPQTYLPHYQAAIDYWNAITVKPNIMGPDFYVDTYNTGARLDTTPSGCTTSLFALADAAGIPCGLCETGIGASFLTEAQWTAGWNYIIEVFTARVDAAKPCYAIIGYGVDLNGQSDYPPGAANAIYTATDFKIGLTPGVPGYVTLWENFSGASQNPTIPAGETVTLPPVAPTPGGGYALADGMSYDIMIQATAGETSTNPFLEVSLTWLNSDTPNAAGPTDPVWFVPMGTNGGNPAITIGSGPQRGQYLLVQVTNLDTSPALVYVTINSAGRQAARHDFRFDAPSGPIIPSFTRPGGPNGTNVLGTINSVTLNGGDPPTTRLMSMRAGPVYVRFGATGTFSMGNQVQMLLIPQPYSQYTGVAFANKYVGSNGNEFGGMITFPRCPVLVSLQNLASSGSVEATVELVAQDV